MTSRSIDIYEIRIPLDAVKKLSDEDRFSYYLLGHIFNELMSLQKIVGFALPKHDDVRPARVRPEHAQAMFLFRIASGKIWEAICLVPCDHIPVRSWPLFRARQLMRDVIESLQEAKKS